MKCVLLPHRERLPISNVAAEVSGGEMLQYHQHGIKLERMSMCQQEQVKKEKREDELSVHCTIKKPVNHGEQLCFCSPECLHNTEAKQKHHVLLLTVID